MTCTVCMRIIFENFILLSACFDLGGLLKKFRDASFVVLGWW